MSEKVRNTFLLEKENSDWLVDEASLRSLAKGRRVSPSKVLNSLIAEKRESDERRRRGLDRLLTEIRRQKETA